MKEKFIKIVSVFAGSSFILALAGYVCGSVILTSFLKYAFDLPFFTGTFVPPVSVIFLGYFLIISCILSSVLLWDFSRNLDYLDIFKFFVWVLMFVIITKVNFSFRLFGLTITVLAIRVLLIVLVLLIFLILSMLARKFNRKLTNFKKKFFQYIPISSLFVILAFLLPVFSKLKGLPDSVLDFEPLGFIGHFYFEYIYILTCITLLTIELKTYIKNSKNKSLAYFNYGIVLVIFVYEFSTVVGGSLANTYKIKGIGLFPNTKIFFSREVEIDGVKMTSISGLKLLSKDSNNYFVFSNNPNKLYLINSSDVASINIGQ